MVEPTVSAAVLQDDLTYLTAETTGLRWIHLGLVVTILNHRMPRPIADISAVFKAVGVFKSWDGGDSWYRVTDLKASWKKAIDDAQVKK